MISHAIPPLRRRSITSMIPISAAIWRKCAVNGSPELFGEIIFTGVNSGSEKLASIPHMLKMKDFSNYILDGRTFTTIYLSSAESPPRINNMPSRFPAVPLKFGVRRHRCEVLQCLSDPTVRGSVNLNPPCGACQWEYPCRSFVDSLVIIYLLIVFSCTYMKKMKK